MKINNLKFIIKQYLKMAIQGYVLPFFYNLNCNKPINQKLILFADSHNSQIPFSMRRMHEEVSKLNEFQIIDYIADGTQMDSWKELLFMIRFMKLYAQAKYVFICDNFLPVSSCQKRSETIVVQLWHSGGLLKKFGFDAPDDIPSYYKLNPYKNYDLVTVSAPCCETFLAEGMHLQKEKVKALGICRSDYYFDTTYIENCYKHFFDLYPEAVGKKIVLWAPTFRGNAASPILNGYDAIRHLQEQLGSDWIILLKIHPHLEKVQSLSNCTIPAEELLPLVDLLITDYSSIIFDYIIFEKPLVLFAPDLDEFQTQRGFYIKYESLPGTIVKREQDLVSAVKKEILCSDSKLLNECKKYHMACCDGGATKRIIKEIGIRESK